LYKLINKGITLEVTDLSLLAEESINDAIDLSICSLKNITRTSGKETVYFEERIAKIDIPVALPHCHCLGMRWEGNTYIGTRLPFGLRSAPKIFNTATDACNASQVISHYLSTLFFWAHHCRLGAMQPKFLGLLNF